MFSKEVDEAIETIAAWTMFAGALWVASRVLEWWFLGCPVR
jgi:hypothetical protein